MIFLRSFFTSLFFLFIASSSTVSLACLESFSFDSIASDSAFVSFAKKHLGETWVETMGAKWEQRITHATRRWSTKDEKDFLRFLQARIGTEDTLKRVKFPSYLSTTSYKKFRERVSLL